MRKKQVIETDYRSRVNAKGGSPPGTVKRKPSLFLKHRAWKWALENIAGGKGEKYFYDSVNVGARFTAEVFLPCIPILWDEYPEECAEYFNDRPRNKKFKTNQEYQAYLISQRVHKMYYWNNRKGRARGISDEHPQHWEEKFGPNWPEKERERLTKMRVKKLRSRRGKQGKIQLRRAS